MAQANGLFGWQSNYNANYTGSFTPARPSTSHTAAVAASNAARSVSSNLTGAANTLTSGINRVIQSNRYPTSARPVNTSSGTSTRSVATATRTLAANAAETLQNWDQYALSRTTSYLDNVAPQWRGIVSTTGASIQNFISTQLPTMLAAETQAHSELVALGRRYLTGAIPNDVAAQVRRVTGETSAAQGATGQQAQNLTARDLGLTSIDMQKFGADLLAGSTAKVTAMTGAAATAGRIGTDYATAARNLVLEGSSGPGDLTNMTNNALQLSVPSANASIAARTSLAQSNAELGFNAAAANRADLFSGLIAQWNAQMGQVAATGANGIV